MADDPPRITSVFSFHNGMTITFDQHGQQMQQYNGRTELVVPRIRAAGFTGEIPLGQWGPPKEGEPNG